MKSAKDYAEQLRHLPDLDHAISIRQGLKFLLEKAMAQLLKKEFSL